MEETFRDHSLSAEDRAKDLLARMTVREKAGQLNQRLYGFSCYERLGNEIRLTKVFTDEVKRCAGLGTLYGLYRADPWSGRDFSNGITPNMAARAYNKVQHYVVEHSRFGIPVLMSSECPHGHQALDGYLLPVNLCVGAAWNPKLLEQAYGVCARQMKSAGVDLALMSVLDVLRDPRWGRSEECYGEDPFLCASLAAAAVSGCQKNGVTSVAKHFCAQGETTGGINASAASIGERELREIHLPPMKACCKVGVGGVMAAYNEIDGIPCHCNSILLNDILRGELSFSGFVMADGTAVDRLDLLTGNNVLSGALALKAGVDVSLWDSGFSHLEEAVKQGYLSEEDLDRAVLRVLTLKFKRGLFEHPYLEEGTAAEGYSINKYPQSLELARQGIVLLKNEKNLLPIHPNRKLKLAVIGPNADSIYHQLGDYSPPLREGAGVTVLQGIRQLAGGNITVEYAKGCGIFDGTDEELEAAVSLARKSDLTVLVLGGSSSRFSGAAFDINGAAMAQSNLRMDCGEGMDCSELCLCGRQNELASKIFAVSESVVTILIQGRPYAVGNIDKGSQALLAAFYPGPWGGLALAEILFGLVCPSGRLPVSMPRSSGQLPVYYNFKASYPAMKYHDSSDGPLYSFGDGLSYTSFVYSDFRLSGHDVGREALRKTPVSLTFSVQNAGGMDGYTVPCLFIHGLQSSIVRRKYELKGFDKVFLRVGERKSVTLTLGYDELAVYDSRHRYLVEPGNVELFLRDGGDILWKDTLCVL